MLKSRTAITSLLLAIIALLAAALVHASAGEGRQHQVVFQMTADTPEQWEGLLANVENLRTALGPARTHVEVVIHGKGIGMALADRNAALAPRMQQLSDAGVVFAACENTLKKNKLSRQALLPFVTTVDSGVAHVVRRQEAGWSYIRVGQ